MKHLRNELSVKEGREYDSWVCASAWQFALEDTCTYFDKYWYFPKNTLPQQT